jgi:hypothetical protein
MGYIFIFIILSSLILLILPLAFRFLFVYILGFSRANIKIKHPLKYMGLFLEILNPIWGMESVIINIPEIRVWVDLKLYKICVVFERPKIILIRNKN